MNIKMGLIGAGRMGEVFAHTLAFSVAEVDLAALADRNPKTGEEMAARFGVDCHYTDYHELLKRDDIDAVVIATPTSTHAQVMKDAAMAGKHIFSEKPLAMTVEMCDEAIAAVKQAGVKLQLQGLWNGLETPMLLRSAPLSPVSWKFANPVSREKMHVKPRPLEWPRPFRWTKRVQS